MNLRLHRCIIDDLDQLVTISRATFRDAFESQNNPDDFQNYLDKAFHPGQLLSELENPQSSYFFVYENELLTGYFKLNFDEAQTELKESSGFELERIYVVAGRQGRNIGAWMLNQVFDIGRKMGKEYLWLGVWEHNAKAIRFYKKYGFTRFGSHPYYVGKDKQTDWLMKLDLSNLEPNKKT